MEVARCPSILTGVGYRSVSGAKQVVLDGISSGYQANWMTTDGGATWGAKRRNTSFTDGKNLPIANSLGSAVGSDKYYAVIGSIIGP